jgi:hypothetical protein
MKLLRVAVTQPHVSGEDHNEKTGLEPGKVAIPKNDKP